MDDLKASTNRAYGRMRSHLNTVVDQLALPDDQPSYIGAAVYGNDLPVHVSAENRAGANSDEDGSINNRAGDGKDASNSAASEKVTNHKNSTESSSELR